VRIADDLAVAIHHGLIQSGEQLPTSAALMTSYGVTSDMAQSALHKLLVTGLAREHPRPGTLALDPKRGFETR
jgi:DNA-binding GntR family transcriptional regulator